MGKSPGRWIKTVLFGKKFSKSHSAKGRERTANEKQELVAATPLECDANSSPVISHPIPVPTVNSERHLEHESQDNANADLPHYGGESLPGNQESNFQMSIPQVELSDDDRRRQEEAATLVQAAFRGYLARRAFRALRGIIRLQALIRGHLVRRQAVATLSCILGVVKMQALARGVKVRNSDIGQDVLRKRHAVTPLEIGNSDGVHVSILRAKLSANAFARKLVASSPIVMPLCLHYDSEEPNSVANWVERWSASCFWKPIPQPKKVSHSKTLRKQGNSQMLEGEAGRPKRSAQRIPAANIDCSLVQTTSEFERPKRNFRKVLSHSADAVQENPQSELEKVKRNLRKVRNSVTESPVQSEVEIEKPKQSLEEVPGTSGDNNLVHSMNNSGEKMKKETNLTPPKLPDVLKNEPTLTVSKLPDVETSLEPVGINEASEEKHGDQPVDDPKPLLGNGGNDENAPFINGELSLKEDPPSNQNHKSNRKASSVVKQERGENGIESNMPALPSYMAATESAKAKLRAEGSPRFSQEGAEKNNLSRRHSLPPSANSKISSQTPRTRAVHSGGKAGGNKSDRPILSSREGNAKAVQVEWRR